MPPGSNLIYFNWSFFQMNEVLFASLGTGNCITFHRESNAAIQLSSTFLRLGDGGEHLLRRLGGGYFTEPVLECIVVLSHGLKDL